MRFTHLEYIKQTYIEHFIDAISYSFMALKACFFFFVHAFLPDIFEFDGSKLIEHLHNILLIKRSKLLDSKF